MPATDVRPAPYPRGAAILVPVVLLGAAFLLPWSGAGNLGPEITSTWPSYVFQAALLLAGGLAGLRALYLFAAAAKQRQLAVQHPAKPWLWRRDWQDGRIANTSGRRMLESLLISVGVAAMAVLVDGWVLMAVLHGETDDLMVYAIAAAAVTLVALFLASEFQKAFRLWWHWRDKRLVLKTLPGRLGQSLEAELTLPDPAPVPLRIRFGVYRAIRGSRNTTLLSKGEAVWEAEAQEHDVPAGASSLALSFDVPKGRPQSDWSRPTERTRWQVSVLLDKRNSFEFEVPVFA